MSRLLIAVFGCFLLGCNLRAATLDASKLWRLRGADGIVRCPRAYRRVGPQRRALLVGISHYQHGGGGPEFADLHTEADLAGWLELMCNTYEFSSVRILHDAEATAARIQEEFQSYLIAQSRAGDSAVFFFSGHGQRVLDQPAPKGDEPDGYDESLVPYDYVTKDATDVRRVRILDDQLDILIHKLQDQVRPPGRKDGSITIILDSCFAGGAVRDSAPLRVRGDDGSWRPAQANTADESTTGLLEKGEARSRDYVVLAAAQSNESAYESDERAVFTAAVLSELRKEPRLTPRMLLAAVSVAIGTSSLQQPPQLEGGAGLDRMLFDSNPGPRMIQVRAGENGTAFLQVGRLSQHVTKGSQYTLYRLGAGTPNLTQPLAQVEVTKPGAKESEVKVIGTGKLPDDLSKTLAVLSQLAPEEIVTVAASPLLLSALQKEIAVVQGEPIERAEFILAEDSVKLCLRHRVTARVTGCVERGKDEILGIADLLDQYLRWRFLRQLALPNGLPIEMHINIFHSALNQRNEITDIKLQENVTEQRTSEGGQIILKSPSGREADNIQIEVKHSYKGPLYVNILEISPDGRFHIIFPDPSSHDSLSPLLASDQWYPLGGRDVRANQYFRRVVTAESSGEVVRGQFLLKLVATTEPLYLSELSWQRGHRMPWVANDGALSPISRLNLNFGQQVRDTPERAIDGWSTDVKTFCVDHCGESRKN